MNKTYRLFKAYCLTVIAVLFISLLVIGIYTVKIQTGEAVFKSTYSTVRVLKGEDIITLNLGGRIFAFSPESLYAVFSRVRLVLLYPINNIIELLGQAVVG